MGGKYLFVVMNDGKESSPSVLEMLPFVIARSEATKQSGEIATASATQKPWQ